MGPSSPDPARKSAPTSAPSPSSKTIPVSSSAAPHSTSTANTWPKSAPSSSTATPRDTEPAVCSSKPCSIRPKPPESSASASSLASPPSLNTSTSASPTIKPSAIKWRRIACTVPGETPATKSPWPSESYPHPTTCHQAASSILTITPTWCNCDSELRPGYRGHDAKVPFLHRLHPRYHAPCNACGSHSHDG